MREAARPEYFLEADQNRTIVHHVAEGELFGLMRLMKPVAAVLPRSALDVSTHALGAG